MSGYKIEVLDINMQPIDDSPFMSIEATKRHLNSLNIKISASTITKYLNKDKHYINYYFKKL